MLKKFAYMDKKQVVSIIGKSNKPNSNSFNIVILNWRESIKQHEESQTQRIPFTTNLVITQIRT